MVFSCGKLITFIIPSRKIDDLLLHCVKKTRKLYPDVEIIAVLDGKDDLSLKNFSLPDNVTLLYSAQTNISSKRNIGSACAKTKYLAFIDSDAYPSDGWAENAVEFLETHSEYGLATGIQKNFPTDSPTSHAIRRLRRSPLFADSKFIRFYDDRQKDNKDCRVVCSANLVVEREKYFKVGGMNENLYVGEDRDFSDRFNKAGIKMAIIPSMSVYHKERTLLPFLRQRYTFSYWVPIRLLRGISMRFCLMAMMPIWGLLFLAASGFLLDRCGIHPAYLLFFLAPVLLLLLLESLRLGRDLTESVRILFIFICVYGIWTVALLFGLLRLPPKPETVYFHA